MIGPFILVFFFVLFYFVSFLDLPFKTKLILFNWYGQREMKTEKQQTRTRAAADTRTTTLIHTHTLSHTQPHTQLHTRAGYF